MADPSRISSRASPPAPVFNSLLNLASESTKKQSGRSLRVHSRVTRGSLDSLAPFTGLLRAAVIGPSFQGGWQVRTARWEARLRAFSLSGFSRASWLKPTNEKPRERGSGYLWRSRRPGVNAGPKTAGAAKPRKRGSQTRESRIHSITHNLVQETTHDPTPQNQCTASSRANTRLA